MTNIIDDRYFEELSEANANVICKNAGCSYDRENKTYSLTAWGDNFIINPSEKIIQNVTGNFIAHNFFYLFIIYYLLHAKDTIMTNEWISEKDLPGGSAFFRGPHEIPTKSIAERFNNNIDAFKQVCTESGGIELKKADAACYFQITPRIPAALLFWAGDEDFPPEAKIMFDKSIAELLTLDIVFALAVSICDRIGKEDTADKTPVISAAGELDKYVGRKITLQGIVSNTKTAAIFDVDVESVEPDLRGRAAKATGILHKEIITEEALEKKFKETGIFANRGPGIFYSLRQPETGQLAHVQAVKD